MARVSLEILKQRAAAVNSSVQTALDYLNQTNEEEATFLSNNWEQLYSMILDVSETLDVVLSDVEK